MDKIKLTVMQQQLLKCNLPARPIELDNQDIDFISSSVEKWNQECKIYKDAGIFNYMEAKQKLFDAIYNPDAVAFEIDDAISNFLAVVPNEVMAYMNVNVSSLISYKEKMLKLREEVSGLKKQLISEIQIC